jgi:pimeloyl-ACP methyl ester carboxylesterase
MGVKNYSAIEVGADIVGLVQALGHSECIAVAHDWGALQCWHHAILYPDVIKALFIVSIPCWEGCPRIGPGSTMDPLSFARQLYRTGEEDEAFWYLNYHNYDYVHTIGRPEDEYDGDPEMVFRKMIGLSLCLSSLSSVQAAYCRTNSRGISPENAKTILIV